MFLRFLAFSVAAAVLSAGTLCAQNPSQQGRGSSANSSQMGGGSGEEEPDYQVAQEFDSAGSTDMAIRAYKRFLKNYPASPRASAAQYRIAELTEARGNMSRAFDEYQTLITRYPDTPEFDKAVAQQVIIANKYLNEAKVKVLGFAVFPGFERAQKMYESIVASAPYSRYAPIAQFNLGLSFERQKKTREAQQAYQTLIDKYPNSDVSDDALYQMAYIWMRVGLSGNSQDLSSLVLAKETFEDFLLQYPNSEKVAQARDNLATIGNRESGDLLTIAKYYDWSKNHKAALIYYNDIIRRQPKSEDAKFAEIRVQELRNEYGDDALRVGPERAETGERTALRRRLEAQVETSALSDYAGPPKRDIVPDELPVARPRMRTDARDVQPLPAPVEPSLPVQ